HLSRLPFPVSRIGLGDGLVTEPLACHFVPPLPEPALGELHDVALVHERDRATAGAERVLDGFRHQPLGAELGHRLDADIAPRTGVVSGPLMATRCVRMASRVASGSQFPACLKAFSPASTSSQSIWRLPSDTFRTVVSNTRRAARQMSGPVPSPSMKGMMG